MQIDLFNDDFIFFTKALKKTTNFATIYPSWNTCFSYYHSFAMTENYSNSYSVFNNHLYTAINFVFFSY